jgi:hypothetical protein
MKLKTLLLTTCIAAYASGIFAQADMQETLGMIKKNLTESKAKIKNYEWIETITTSLKGEEKSVKQNQCYYSVDGKLTKVATGGTTAAKTKGGIRGKVASNKKEDMVEYIQASIAKVQTYLPPDAGKLQQIYAAGKATIQVLEPGKKFKLSFPDYNVPGDVLSITLNKATQKIMAVDVNTYIDDAADKVIFNVTFSDLPDGTQYENTTSLNAQAKQLKVVITNSGFKKAAAK